MTKTTIIKDMHRHVLDLCDKHGITIYAWCRRTSQCHALIDREEIRISSTLVRERWAWEWARANALIWTPGMENSARKAVKWYARHAASIDRC
jgi:hypothetical protein